MTNFGSFSTQKECIIDFHEQKKKGFTLAETLITLTILGIVAALTIPNLVRRQVEASNRTKIKKVVGVYDTLMTKLTVQNNLKSNAAIQEWADDDCTNSSDLFKVVKFVSTDNKCQFKTADGVFWDITDIQKPIIALKETDLNDATAQSDTNRAFYLFAEYDGQGILRVTEPTYDYTLTADKTKVNESIDRLIAFMKGETTTKLNEIEVDPYAKYSTPCPSSCQVNYASNISNNCYSCTYSATTTTNFYNQYQVPLNYQRIFDENGNLVKTIDEDDFSNVANWTSPTAKVINTQYYDTQNNMQKSERVSYYKNGKIAGETITDITTNTVFSKRYNEDGNPTSETIDNGNDNTWSVKQWTYDEHGTATETSCSSDKSGCDYCDYFECGGMY